MSRSEVPRWLSEARNTGGVECVIVQDRHSREMAVRAIDDRAARLLDSIGAVNGYHYGIIGRLFDEIIRLMAEKASFSSGVT